jgi:hypothetical protein
VVQETTVEQDALVQQLAAAEEAQLEAEETWGADFVIESTNSDDDDF